MIETIIRALKSRIMSMVGKAIIHAVNDDSGLQLIKMSMLKDEVRSDVERVQSYGFSGNPPLNSEAVYFSIGGDKDNCIILNIDSAKYRIKGLKSGEVAIYSMFNGENDEHSIILKKDKSIEINCENGIFSKDLEIKGDLNIEGEINATGDINSSGDMSATDFKTLAFSLKNHAHAFAALGTPSPAIPVPPQPEV